MNHPEIQLVVLDLDNTLYDWVSFFVPAFYSMVEAASPLLETPVEKLLSELQDIHRRYHNSEQPYALLEIRTVVERYPLLSRAERAEKLDGAFHAFNRERKKLLRLFPGVAEALQEISACGCNIVAHTEAVISNSYFRLSALEVTNVIQRLYAPADRGLGHPKGLPNSFGREFVRLLPSDHRKPSPEVLLDIMADFRVQPEHTLYIGDSIVRDIAMAKHAGAWAAWAKYGTEYDRSLWDKLVRVTHWTSEDVQRESELKRQFGAIAPDATLSSLRDVFAYFRFIPAANTETSLSSPEAGTS